MYFSKNLLKGCVLRLLNGRILSFQELSAKLNHIEPIGEGTLLAALAELEKTDGFVLSFHRTGVQNIVL